MRDWGMEELLPIVLQVGEINLKCMALLDKANTETSQQRKNEALKRLQVVEAFRESKELLPGYVVAQIPNFKVFPTKRASAFLPADALSISCLTKSVPVLHTVRLLQRLFRSPVAEFSHTSFAILDGILGAGV